MNRKTVIVVVILTPPKIECFGNFKKACLAHNWKYNTLSKIKLPIKLDGCIIDRVPFS